MRIAAAMLMVAGGMSSAAAQAPVDFAGVWWNERCSNMDLTVAGEMLSGTYTSAVGANAGKPYAITGYRAGVDLIAFSVNFGETGSLASWAGQHTNDRGTEKIVTLWHLAVNVPDNQEQENLWSAVWSGADNFARAKPSSCP